MVQGWLCALALGLLGCGRIGFGPGDASDTSDASDASDTPLVDVVPPSGLILHFEFEPNAFYDDTAGGRIGNCTNCPLPAQDARGAVASFSSSQCMYVGDDAALRPAQFTVAAWVKLGGASGGGIVFHRPRDRATSDDQAVSIFMNMFDSAWGVSQTFVNDSAVAVDEWHHVAGTFDGLAQLYIDGLPISSLATSAPAYTVGDRTYVGCRDGVSGFNDWFVGMIDSVRMYDRALSPSEVADVMAL